jgi:hypothetical protein
MKECIAIINRSLHVLKRDYNSQNNFFNDLKYPDYIINGSFAIVRKVFISFVLIGLSVGMQ